MIPIRAWLAIFLAISLLTGCSSPTPQPAPLPAAGAPVKLFTNAAGLFELGSVDLNNAGFGQVPPERLYLTLRGVEQPFWVEGSGKDLRLRFYAAASQSPNLAQNIYWLQSGAPRSLPALPAPANLGASAQPGVSLAVLTLEENRIYTPQVERGDGWFWMTLSAPAAQTLPFTLTGLLPGAGSIEVDLWSATSAPLEPDHRTRLSVNDRIVLDQTWEGAGQQLLRAEIPTGTLVNGENRLKLELPGLQGVTAEIAYLNRVRITYPRALVAENDRLWFTASGAVQSLAGFSGAVTVVNLSDPSAPLPVGTTQNGAVLFQGQAGSAYLAAGAKGWQKPASLAPALTTPNLRDAANQADALWIGPPDLLSGAQALADFRASAGVKLLKVPAQAVFDQFSDGFPEPAAIRAFLQAARQWQTPPRSVLLFGDASYDPLGYTAPPEANRLPTVFVNTIHGGWTASDIPLADLDGDNLPDLALGRIPARTTEQVRAWAEKSIAFEQALGKQGWSSILAVADGQEASFREDAGAFLKLFPASAQSTLINPQSGAKDAASQISTALKNQPALMAYFGHGSLAMWGKDRLLHADDISSLAAGARTGVLLQFTCLSGLFTHPKAASLSEALLFQPQAGAAALLAPTSLTLASDQALLSAPLAQALQNQPSLGTALLKAQRQVPVAQPGALDVLQTFLLFGDPEMRIR